MKSIKTVFLVISLAGILTAQNEWVLQPWMEVEGDTSMQRLGLEVGYFGKKGDTAIVSVTEAQNVIKVYYLTTPADTIPRYTLTGYNCSTGDFNGDGIKDLLVNGNPTEIYLGISPGVFDTIPFFVKYQEPEGYAFGRRIAVGKINGDIYDDLVVTDAGYPDGNNIGRVYLFWGGMQMDTVPSYIVSGGYSRSGFGWNVTTGNLNNDEYDDIIVRGYDSNNPVSSQRFPYLRIFLGGNTIDTAAWKYFRGTLTSSFGLASFDVNGDGVKDLLWTNYSLIDSMNSVYIHFSENNDIDTLPSLVLSSNWAQNVADAGDMNGDGYEDILISSNGSDQGGSSYIFVYSGGPKMDENFDAAAGIGGVSNLGAFGSIAGVGDINGDGLDDILVGAYAYKWFTEKGKWFIFLGDSSIPVTSVREKELSQPEDFVLYQNYPNPFNPRTVIGYNLSVISNVQITIYDVLGKEITTLVNEEKFAGEYETEFDAQKYKLSSGIYYYKITLTDSKGNKQTQTKSMVLIK